MPRGRMQHTAALPHGKSCSAYAANAIMFTWKKNFLQTFFRLPKLWNKIGQLGLIFFSNWLIPFWNSLLIICRAASFDGTVASFDGTDNLPIEFLGHAASNGMPQPSRRNVQIYLWHGATFAAWPCRCVPRSIVWTYLYKPMAMGLSQRPVWENNRSVRQSCGGYWRTWYNWS